MTVALIDYGAGNLQSVRNALAAAGADSVVVTADPTVVAQADRIVLPGVGAFGHCMQALSAIDGMTDALTSRVRLQGTPFLGICVGMQMMAAWGEEHGRTQGLGWVPGTVRVLNPVARGVRVPHMGWNQVVLTGTAVRTPLEAGQAYFLHSFAYDSPADAAEVAAMTDHGGSVVAALVSGTALGVQFHPEKSQAYGLSLLQRFLTWRP